MRLLGLRDARRRLHLWGVVVSALRIISPRRYHESTEHRLFFETKGAHGGGYSFACDAKGTVDVDKLPAAARISYARCLELASYFEEPRVETRHNAWTEAAVGRCECGARVDLDSWTNTCDGCGADYDKSGFRLAERSQWGEETGETAADILGVR
jgi:hypothetical protein